MIQSAWQPIAQTPFDESKARLSPDGRAVAYVSNESGRNQVYLQAIGTTTREQVSTDGGTDPVWARSGRELFYRNGRQVMTVTVEAGGEPTSRPQMLFAGDYILAGPATKSSNAWRPSRSPGPSGQALET